MGDTVETPVEQVPPQVQASGRRRKATAVIAGGLVLGVGAAITLAAWNDSEFATGSFGTGALGLEGSTDGTVFSNSLTTPGKILTFVIDADALSPGDVVAVPFAVQLSAASAYAADLMIAAVSADSIAADLTYDLVDTGTFVAGCDETTAGTILVNDAATTASGPTVLPSFTAAATPLNLCFIVTAGPDIAQNLTGSVTWEFVGTSTDLLP